jgi:preprotein translocase subunit SecF
MKKEKDPSERVEFGRHWGDWSAVIMAVLFLIAFLAFLSTDFLAGLDKTDQVLNRIQQEQMTKAEKQARQREINAAEATGVVQVGIAPPKKPTK